MLWLFAACSAAIVFIWLGYPVLVALAASVIGRRSVAVDASRPPVSVVIATVDDGATVRARVADVLRADYPADLLEVVVALDRKSTASPDELRALDARVNVVAGDAPGGKAASLNAAVRAANGAVLVFTDSAQRFDATTISRLVEALRDPALGAVSGALQIGSDGAPANLSERYWQFEKWLRRQEARLHSTVGVTGAVYAMRRAYWAPLPAGLILDDVYVPMRLVLQGHRVGFEPSARAVDERRFPPAQEFRRKARTLTGVLQLCAWLPDILLPWRNPIWVQFLFHKLLRLATPYLLLVSAVSLTVWVAGQLQQVSTALAVGVIGGAVAAAALLTALSRPLRSALQMAVSLQAAVVRATVNGLRGEWDVWSR